MADEEKEKSGISLKIKKLPAVTIDQAGKVGVGILNDIVRNATYLAPVSGRVFIEINIEVADKTFFKDEEARTSKIIIEVNLEKSLDK